MADRNQTTKCPVCGVPGGWHDSKCQIGMAVIAAQDGSLKDAPPLGRTPQRETKAILADYGVKPHAAIAPIRRIANQHEQARR